MVTKNGGHIYIAFILFDLTMLSWGFVDKNIYDNIDDNKQVSNDFMPKICYLISCIIKQLSNSTLATPNNASS